MLKRISVQQLTLGMYLKDFCGSWMEHPFWRSAFVITDPKDLASIRASSITEVWIDCAKGLDLAPDDSPVAVAESVAEVDIELASTASKKRETASVSSGVELPARPGSSPGRGRQSPRCSEKRAWARRSIAWARNDWSMKFRTR
jgi:hypothetical protein